jgi:stage III sporulation protein SpoIIIAA
MPEAANDLDLLIGVLPTHIRERLEERGPDEPELFEVVLDLGRTPEVRFRGSTGLHELCQQPVSEQDLQHVVARIGEFGDDNRAGIERTLHRISAIRNRTGKVVGLTCRVGRAIYGTIDILRDIVEDTKGILLMGRPGIGKTTMLREMARVSATELGRRVVVVDTSNEIGGDGDIPHPAIGRARRMQVPHVAEQHAIMIEAVENHMPEVIVIDEIGTEAEALAARTIAERGVQLIGTAHGTTLENLLMNPTLADLVGGIQAVTLGDDEARRRGTQKTVLERKAPPTFDVVVEILEMDKLAVHHDVAESVDVLLRGMEPSREIRVRRDDGQVEKRQEEPEERTQRSEVPLQFTQQAIPTVKEEDRVHRIFPYGISRDRVQRAIEELHLPALITKDPKEADMVITLRAHQRRFSNKHRASTDAPVFYVRSNTYSQVYGCLRNAFSRETKSGEEEALAEAKSASLRVLANGEAMELRPQGRHIRKMQHELADEHRLVSRSVGRDPFRRVVIERP